MSRGGLGPGLLLLPVLSFGAAAVWWGPSEAAVPPVAESLAERHVWVATLAAGTARLELRLAPLHGSAIRRAFEGRALRERRGLPDGELWRLEVRAASGDPGAAALDPRTWRVVDDLGDALTPLGPGHDGPGAVGHPVDRLLTTRAFTPTADWTPIYFWGREPGAGGRLSGIRGSLDGAPSSVSLAPERVASAELPSHLLRIRRGVEDSRSD